VSDFATHSAVLTPKLVLIPQGMTRAELQEVLRRRVKPAALTAVAVLAVALSLAAFWPASYRAVGTILIEQQELPSDLVQSTVTSFADQRIQVISQRVMTTDNLLRIVARYSLYPELRKRPREMLLARMRKDIHLQMISADVIDPRQGHPTKANIAFAVSYQSVSSETAARVANEIISLYLDENVKARRLQSADATAFLEDEAKKLDQSMAKLESTLTDFKNKHMNTLPDQGMLNKETLLRAQDEVREIDTQIHSLEQQATYLDGQLALLSPSAQIYTSTGERVMSPADRLKVLRSEYATVSGLYLPDHPDVVRLKQEIEGLEREAGKVDSSNDLQRQLEDKRAQLSQLQERYAPDHPDVVRLQQEIDHLSQAISSAGSTSVESESSAAHPDNPPYLQLKTQREVNSAERAALEQKRAEEQSRIAEFEDRLAAAPGVEREYADLVRNLDNEQIKYREVRQKQMAAKLSENLEDEQKGERFTLIDPPLAPEEPSSPNRPLLVGFGFAIAVAAGLGLIMLLEGLDGTVRSRRELEGLLEVAPLAVLPWMPAPAELTQQRRQLRVVLIAVAGLCVLALVLTHLFYRPLDLLWYTAVRRFTG
jgi:succinoglycan biosynthesis transport protein ExoP